MMEYVNLGDVATYINGYAFKPEHRGKKGLPIIRIQDLNGNSHDLAFFDGKYPEQVEINTGDILISWSGSLGVYKWNKGKALLNQHIFKVLFNKIEIDKEYFCYAIRNSLSSMSQQTHGATMKHITKKDFDNISIPYPDLIEQKKIANNLNIVNKLIMFYEKELILFEQMVKARFIEMFGDPLLNPNGHLKEKIEKHINLLSGYPFKSEQYVEKGINICGGLIIMPQKIKWDECVHWSSVEGFEDYLLNENDIVMALDRPWISGGFKIAKVDAEHLPALLIQRTARIRSIDINQDYLYYCFITGGFDKHSNVTGSLVPHISAKDIRSFEIMIPPVELQNQFADFIQQVDKSRFDIKKSITEIEREVVYD